jgi:hypothetical protein
MSKKILGLASDVGVTCKNKICTIHEDKILEFAKLLINESIEVMTANDYHGHWLGDKLKQHFGIEKMSPCPFCGHEVDLDDGDTLYPNSIAWKVMDNGMTTYHSLSDGREFPKEQWCWTMHCPTTAGGCGAEISADSRDEAIQKWNTRHE